MVDQTLDKVKLKTMINKCQILLELLPIVLNNLCLLLILLTYIDHDVK